MHDGLSPLEAVQEAPELLLNLYNSMKTAIFVQFYKLR